MYVKAIHKLQRSANEVFEPGTIVEFDGNTVEYLLRNSAAVPATDAEIAAAGFKIDEPVVDDPDALREDGPTVAEWVEAGYMASNYPPSGYASRSTDEEIAAAIAAEEPVVEEPVVEEPVVEEPVVLDPEPELPFVQPKRGGRKPKEVAPVDSDELDI